MEKVKEVAEKLHILPKLKLGIKLTGGGVKSTGPHHVKFIAEPTIIMGKDDKNLPRKEFRFEVEEAGITYRWQVPIMGKDGQPSYLIEKLMHIAVGDERILEMMKERGRNYIDVRGIDEAPDDEPPEGIDEEEELAKALKNEEQSQ
jgi:hypothetical protein